MVLKVRMILPIGKSNKSTYSRGFTLIELLLVLVLLGVVLGMSVSAFSRGNSYELKQFSRQLLMDFRLAQTAAINRNATVRLTFDKSSHAYVITALSQPEELLLKRSISTKIAVVSSVDAIDFFANGSSGQAQITVICGGLQFSINNKMHRFQWVVENGDTQENL